MSIDVKFKEHSIDISTGNLITVVAALFAGLSALYARWSAKESKKANDIGLLNALLAIRVHYLELMAQNGHIAEQLRGIKGADKAYEAYAVNDAKLREVNKAIIEYHAKIVGSKI